MSFSAEVRDELARCEPKCEYCDLATLAALVRVCGTLSFAGPGRYLTADSHGDGCRRSHHDRPYP